MKFVSSQLNYFFQSPHTQKNVFKLLKFLGILALMIIAYSILFHYIMASEGHEHSWLTGFYWTLTVMTTLGFGDITFHTDLGRGFSLLVLMSGVIFLLVLLPFTFIQFFYAPWLEAQNKTRAPRKIDENINDHVIITTFDSIVMGLIKKLDLYGREYVIIVEELQRALEIVDMGYKVIVGNADDPETYKNAAVERAALVVAIGSDEFNTNIAFTVRELSAEVPIVTNATSVDSIDILELAGSSVVVNLKEMLGNSLSRRTIGGDPRANVIGKFDELLIAEAPTAGTPLIGKSLTQLKLREKIGVNVVGIWDRGKFELPSPNSIITPSATLVFSGTEAQLARYDEIICIYHTTENPVIIIGAGDVGIAAAKSLEDRGFNYVLVEKDNLPSLDGMKCIIGNAADIGTLKKAGIKEAPSVLITTNDDAMNIYLTIYCRRLREDIHIISRSNEERNISTLHRAGADIVMSYASLGASVLFNLLKKRRILMVAEGLDIFQIQVPESISGKTIIEANIRNKTGCSVLAVFRNGELILNPEPNTVLGKDDDIVLIGTIEAEKDFKLAYSRASKGKIL
ncbi:MAG: potassium channel protein [Candidatus Kapabacteria bacterium]|nr:potassium channel protein [Ignavibacteriota bacterium]MCW5884205.1 potassium channel protein [Candidatus Kapabacteria bacterium]